MQINPLQTNLMHLFNNEPIKAAVERFSDDSNSFSSILSESFNTASVTDTVDKSGTIELLMGESDDLAGLLIDAQKSELALQLALQIRNKIIDAYNEVMRMQV
ncbi:MAG: flagellar hook-basal body complex protein FliE [Oscillospiraceae bacterium]|nr:flagellar hook-basal body complex protein FliE [Oscillospiraceae bacterium]